MKKQKTAIVAIVLLYFLPGFVSGWYIGWKRGIPFVGTERTKWAIGVYAGDSPISFSSTSKTKNPVLTANDVTDIQAAYIADPFMVHNKDTWYVFFEVMNEDTKQGDIAFASSNDALNWTYQHVVLDEPFHLSYPYVFQWNGEYYMIPETKRANSIRLYKAVDFPSQWTLLEILIDKVGYVDPSIFYFNGMWWMFAASGKNDTLHLHYADELTGPWSEHPMSPVIRGDRNIARPAGRVLVFDGRIIRYTQDDYPDYGNQVRAFEITNLTTTSYEENEVCKNLMKKPKRFGWNKKGMHHIDAHQLGEKEWIAVVDGYGTNLLFGLKY